MLTTVLKTVSRAALPAVGAALILGGQALAAEWKRLVEPAELAPMLGAELVVLDIRAPAAYSGGHIPGALSAPYPTWRGPRDNPGRALAMR